MPIPAAPTPDLPQRWSDRFIAQLKAEGPESEALWDTLERMGARPWQMLPASFASWENLMALLLGRSEGDRAARWAATWTDAPEEEVKAGVIEAQKTLYQTAPDDSVLVTETLVDLAASSPHPWAWSLAIQLLHDHLPEEASDQIWAAVITEFERVYAKRPPRLPPVPADSALAQQGHDVLHALIDQGWLTPLPPDFIKGHSGSDWATRWAVIAPRVPQGQRVASLEHTNLQPSLPPADPFFEGKTWRRMFSTDEAAWKDPQALPLALALDLRPTDLVPVLQGSSVPPQPIGLYTLSHREAPPEWRSKLKASFPDLATWMSPAIRTQWMGNLMSDWGDRPADHPQPPAAIGAAFWACIPAKEANPSLTWWTQYVVPCIAAYDRSAANLNTSEGWSRELCEAEHARHVRALGGWIASSLQQGWLDLLALPVPEQAEALTLLARLDQPDHAMGLGPLWEQPAIRAQLAEARAFRLIAAAPSPEVWRDPQVQAALRQPDAGRSADWEAARRYLALQAVAPTPPRPRPRPRA